MKDIINSSNRMRTEWTNLVQIEEGDKAVRTSDGSVDRYKRFPTRQYLIEGQLNQQGAPHWYVPISEKFAQKLIDMDIDEAVEAMRRYQA
jgi:hypothetical protein